MGVLACRALAICAIAACYRPAAERSCAFRCEGVDDGCPSGFACSNGFCAGGNDSCSSDGGVIDTPVASDATDAPVDPPGEYCIGTAIRVCLPSEPTANITLGGDFSTQGADCAVVRVPLGLATEVCVYAGANITVDQAARFTGPRPAVIVAVSTLTIDVNKSVDVGSTAMPASFGAGYDASVCTAVNASDSFEGGAGGTYIGRGGRGGASGSGAGGTNPIPPAFRGGCPGGHGSINQTTPGAGGGTVQLIADTEIIVNGSVYAGGAGGLGGEPATGGGGGGSGGYVGLDSPVISLGGSSAIVVVGGGGGGGGGSTVGSNGIGGGSPNPGTPFGQGGTGGGTGGDGGSGGGSLINGEPGMPGVSSGAAGGGGGGGVGVIKFYRELGGCGGRCIPDVTP